MGGYEVPPMPPANEKFVVPKPKKIVKPIPLAVCLVLIALANFVPVGEGASHRCWILLVTMASLWCTEAVPLFVTSLCAVPLIVFMDVLLDHEGKLKGASASAIEATESFFEPVILLFMGALTMALALEKYGLGRRLANLVLSKAGTNPKKVALYMMLLGCFLSMWVSNVSAAIITLTAVKTLVEDVRVAGDKQYSKLLLLGIAFACDVGGMTTIIASPQNAIAAAAIQDATSTADHPGDEVTMLQWIMVCSPVAYVAVIIDWVILELTLKPKIKEIPSSVQKNQPPLNKTQWIVLGVCTAAVLLCIATPLFKDIVGHVGVVMILPVIVFYGTGILSRHDFNSMPWDVLILLGGGLALGDAIKSSQLLTEVTEALKLLAGGASLWPAVFLFVILMTCVASVISHTIASIVCLPLFAKVGLGFGHTKLFSILTVLMASGTMALPVSGFPNTNAFSFTYNDDADEEGDEKTPVKVNSTHYSTAGALPQAYQSVTPDIYPSLSSPTDAVDDTALLPSPTQPGPSAAAAGGGNSHRYLSVGDFLYSGSIATLVNVVLVMTMGYVLSLWFNF